MRGSTPALGAASFGAKMAPIDGSRPSKSPFFGFSLILETLSHSAPQRPSGKAAISAAQGAGGADVRMGEASVGIPAIFDARAEEVQGEWSLVTLALNLRRMASMEAAAVPV